MEKLIRFFLTHTRLNYTAFVFIILLGAFSYQSIPKDVFPSLSLNKVEISGGYSGASIDTLNKMVVTKLEKQVKALDGIKKVDSFIANGGFSIILTLSENFDKYALLNKIKDITSANKSDLPSDMDEPNSSIIDWTYPLINVTISSNKFNDDELVVLADDLKSKLSSIANISKIDLHKSTQRVYEIVFDNKKIELYGLNKTLVQREIQNLSYIFPLGEIKAKDEHLYISSKNGASSASELLSTMMKIDGKILYLADIATAKKTYLKSDVFTYLNGEKNIQLSLYKNKKANAITLAKKVKREVEKYNNEYKDVSIGTFYDMSVLIKKRLNTVVSGIMFGLLLVSIAIYILINKRVAFIVVLGIPTAILIGVVFLSFTSMSINMITLIGVLLILGLLVDDAVIIAENIQRHISLGEDKLQSAILGIKEVILPILASSLTTIFAFIPMMMLTGELGSFLKIIPIAVVVLILASLVDSFIFVPIHALHVLNKGDKELDWSKANNVYKKYLTIVLHHKKKFVFIFAIAISFMTILLISNMRYQMFPDYDGDRFFINGKFNINHNAQEVKEKTQYVEQRLLKLKKELGLKSILYTVGLRTDNQGNSEKKASVFQLNVELEDRVAQNFVDRYITPIFSFDMNDDKKIRIKSVDEIILFLNEEFKDYKPEGLLEFAIKKEGAGITQNDIEIMLSSKDQDLLMQSIKEIKKQLKRTDGVIFVDDTAKKGLKELKLELNEYGQSLGFSEAYIANVLSSAYLKASETKGLDKKGLIKFITYDTNKDSLEAFKDFEIDFPDTKQKIALREIVSFIYLENFDLIYKQNGLNIKAVVANVNNKVITSTEVLALLDSKFKALEEKGVTVILHGEEKQNQQMMKELSFAFFISVFLIFLTLLVMFNSFKYVFIILSLIPLSITGAVFGHLILGMNLTISSIIGILGLVGVVINDAIVMLDFVKKCDSTNSLIHRATLRLRPIIITSITTFLGLSTLIFFATGESKILQPLAVSLGFGLLWGTVLTLLFLPALFAMSNKRLKDNK